MVRNIRFSSQISVCNVCSLSNFRSQPIKPYYLLSTLTMTRYLLIHISFETNILSRRSALGVKIAYEVYSPELRYDEYTIYSYEIGKKWTWYSIILLTVPNNTEARDDLCSSMTRSTLTKLHSRNNQQKYACLCMV